MATLGTDGKPKAWYQSQTKLGALLLGISALFGTLYALSTGLITLNAGVLQILTEVGAVLTAFGVRDLPILNTIKGLVQQ